MATPTPVFPAAVADTTQLKVANNQIQTTLTVAIDGTNTILFVASAAGFTANCLVSIDKEILAISSVSTSPNPSLTVASGGRGFDGTAAATHAAGAKVSMLIDAWHHNVLAAEIMALETFLGPNGQNLAALQGYRSMSYNFAPQSPGGSLAPGNNVITLRPVPPGVNGTDTNHYLYISGGTGTAEAAPITGGTAVSGAASGTVIVNCANAHSGAWTIASATGGIQEAVIVVAAAGGSATVEVNQPAGAPALIHAPVNFPNVAGQIVIEGLGRECPNVERASDYKSGNLFQQIDTVATVCYRNLAITGSKSWGATAGASVYAQNTQSATVKRGPVWIESCGFIEGEYGVRAIGVCVEIRNSEFLMFDQTYKEKAAISIEGPYQPGVNQPASNHFLTDIAVYSGSVTNANALGAGLKLNGVDGLIGVNLLLQGQVGLLFYSSAGNYNTVVSLDHVFIDQAGDHAIQFSSDGTGSTQMITIANSHASGAVNSNGVDLGFSTTGLIARIRFTNLESSCNGLAAIAVGTATQVQFEGGQICANNQKNQSFVPGVWLYAGAKDIIVSGMQIFNDATSSGYAGGHQKFGVLLDGPSTNIRVTGNDLKSSSEGPLLQINGQMTGGLIGNNTGIDDRTPTNYSLAAAFTWPSEPIFSITGTGTITSVAAFFAAGKTGFVQGGCTFQAGAGIGNTITLTAGVFHPWMWDGAKVWIS